MSRVTNRVLYKHCSDNADTSNADTGLKKYNKVVGHLRLFEAIEFENRKGNDTRFLVAGGKAFSVILKRSAVRSPRFASLQNLKYRFALDVYTRAEESRDHHENSRPVSG